MSKRFTYLLAGLVAVTAALPATVSAQSIRLNSPQVVHKLQTKRLPGDVKTESKGFLQTVKSTKAPRHASGKTYNVPYLEEFNDQSSLNDYTIIDANNDGSTWDYYSSTSSSSNESAVRYHWNSRNPGDDWLITPGINLQAGRSYNVAYKVRSTAATYPERIEAKWGRGTTVADLTEELTPSRDIASSSWIVIRKNITPTADGAYNFGFHAVSDPDEYWLIIDSISVTENSDEAAPDSVTNLKAIADPTGALNVTLSFNAPSKRINGTDLSAIDSIVVRKGNETISVLKSVTPGSAQSVVDNNAQAGSNTYTIVPVNEKGNGRSAKISVSAGPDKPTSPVVTATDNLTSIKFTWPDVTGANGGIIIPSDVYYDVWSTAIADDGSLDLGDSITSVKGVNEYDLAENTTTGDQGIKYWAFNAHNVSGASLYSLASVIEGAPYVIPYSNSFANASLGGQFFGVAGSSDYPTWAMTSDGAADNDGGTAIFYNTMTSYYGYDNSYPGEATLYTGKISLAGAQNPELIFSYNGSTSKNARLVAELEHNNGVVDSLWSESFTSGTGSWETATIPLPASAVDEPYVTIHFRGVANDDNEQEIYVDNIHIVDPYQNDAAVSLAAPETLKKGQEANLVATVSNEGSDDLSGLEVKISVNDEVIADTTIAKTLSLFDKVEIPATYKTSSTQSFNSLNVKAEVINPYDLDDENNTAVANIALTQPELNAPVDLQGSENGDSVSLSWTAPEESVSYITDGFEDYTAWATANVGDWTFINGDGATFAGLSQNGDEPNAYAYAAYEVWHPEGLFQEGQGLEPHSGKQCLASPYRVNINGNDTYVDADDWIITPELNGSAQTISFWANNVARTGFGTEQFQVLASATTKDTANFTQIGDDYTLSSGTWTQFSIDLPAGTKYFAIRRVTKAAYQYVFLVDDITYETGTTAVSYNIYVDGEFAGNTTGTTYTTSAGANHTYSVTAVYSDGSESEPATIDLVANSIDDIHAQLNADKYDVYTIGGAQVKIGAKSLNGLTPGVYVINGKKVILK